MTTRIFYDTEFLERGPGRPIDLISIGMVRDDGATLYAVNADFDQRAVRAHPWLHRNVWPHLPLTGHSPQTLDTTHPDVRPRGQIAHMVRRFVLALPHPELWAWYASYDHVVLAQLFGTMAQLPTGFPMWTNDLRQEVHRLGNPRLPEAPRDGAEPAHHALADARALAWRASYLDRKTAQWGVA